MRRHSDIDNAAGLNDVEAFLLGSSHQLVAFTARVEPQLVAAASGDFGECFEADDRREVDADAVELHVGRDGGLPQPFDAAGVDRCLGVATEPVGAGRSYEFALREGPLPEELVTNLKDVDDPFGATGPLGMPE